MLAAGIMGALQMALAPFLYGPARSTGVTLLTPTDITTAIANTVTSIAKPAQTAGYTERQEWDAYTQGRATTAAFFGPVFPALQLAIQEAVAEEGAIARLPDTLLHVHRSCLLLYPTGTRIPIHLPEGHPLAQAIYRLLVRANWQVGGWRQALATFSHDALFSLDTAPASAHVRLQAKAAGFV